MAEAAGAPVRWKDDAMDLDNRRLDDDEIEAALARLDGWRLAEGMLCREYVFSDFVEAVGFMVRTAFWAEMLSHHPEWSNVYNTVTVELRTHDVGGISALDFELAAKMNELAGHRS
jgi:4a-hydroxytetrahydrobiopterin dehydratase